MTFQITWAESSSELFYIIASWHYYHLLQSYWANFNQTWHRKVKRIQNYTNKGSHPFPMGDNYEIAKIHFTKFKKSFPREPLGLEWRGFKFVQTKYHLILKNFLLLMIVMILSYLSTDLNRFLVWAMWFISLLLENDIQKVSGHCSKIVLFAHVQ